MNKLLLSAALAGVLTAGAAAQAAAPAADAAATKVKCYGIAMAGKNDCKSATGSHSCQGLATKDKDPGDWNFAASKDECTKAGGSVTAPAAKM